MSFIDSDLSTLAVVLFATVGGIFCAIILGGLLSGLVTLGALELYFRERIQKQVLNRHFALNWSSSSESLGEFLTIKYGKIDDNSEGRPGLMEYTERLLRSSREGDFLPILARMDRRSLYQLHYRQICGQIQSAASGESLRSADERTFAPLNDVLGFLAHHNGSIDQRFQYPESRPPNSERARDELETSLREIDNIQANLGRAISNRTSYAVFWIWFAVYFVILAAFLLKGLGARGSDIAFFLFLLFAVVAATALSLATTVVGTLAFTWFDRVLASK